MPIPPPEPGFEEIEHTADWALRVTGEDLSALLRNAARGMTHLLIGNADVPRTHTETLELDAFDAETLLVNWLSELAYRAEVDGLLFPDITLTDVSPTHLRAVLRGGRVADLQKHIKAVTYHNLQIVRTPHGLEATVVFDV
ncbi:MAG: archease [Caldilineae bacterium]|nr:MAG: archease [Caldilineae bacterium]